MKNLLESVFSDPVASVSPRKKLRRFEGDSEYPLPQEKRTRRIAKEVGSRMKRVSSTGSSKLLVPIATPSRSSKSKKTTSTPPPKRMLRGSASFSGTSSYGTSSGPRRSSGELARHGSVPVTISSSRRRILAPHNIELDDGAAMGCQQVDHSVQVIIRARPVSDAENAQQGQSARCVLQENAITVAWLGHPETRFTFDHVADEFVTQEELFHVAGLPMVDNCMAGYNSCMFAYGQTGSGKTHTMLGDLGDYENRGMTPRVFEYLFAKIRTEGEAQKQRKLKYQCRCSFLEIYNEQIFDLLEPSSSNLQMREDGKKGVFVEGLLEVGVQTVEEVLHLLLRGATNRKVAATHMNRESSRSHSVFTCVIESQWEYNSMMNFRFGRLNLVDLAGSERQKDTGVDEERLREAASINKSLSTLGLVIMVLVDIANGKHRHVPYRDSKLTFLLQDSLGGNSKTTIIANISPSSCASSETLSTLKFAQRAKFIQNNAVVNEEASGDVKGLRQQIQQLKDELAHVRRQSIGKAAPTPTALNLKMEALLIGVLRREKFLVKSSAAEIEHLAALLVKQRQDETYFHKSIVQSQEPKIRSEPCHAEESSGDLSELELMCNNLDQVKLDMENVDLQGRLRRCQEYDGFEERETMVQDISNLRNKLLDMLDTNLSMDTAAALLQQQEAWAAKLAVERQATDQFRNEVEACQRDLSECQMKLQTSLDSNERIASELDALRMELESSRDECSMHKRELEAMQKALEVNGWEIKQVQHQQFVFELKTQLEKSEEKVAQEKVNRSQIALQLQEAMQESANLQTELQWTRDSLEEAEAVVETFQRIEPVLEIGDPEAAYEFFMVGQLQAEIIEMNARLEEERRHRRELDNQTKANNSTLHESPCETNNDHKQKTKPLKEKRKIRHQDAILQLQMELDSVDDGASLQPVNNNTQIQLDMETTKGALAEERQLLTEARVTSDHHRQQLEELTPAKLMAEKTVLNSTTDSVQCSQLLVFSLDTENADLQDQFQETQADPTTLKSTIANLQKELQEKNAEIAALVAQLHVSDRHVFKLERQSVELRDAMRRQGVAVKVLYEKFQKQESLQLQEERVCRENATQLQSRVELLQQELEKMKILQNEKTLIYEELHSLRSSAAQKIEQLRNLVEDLEKHRGQLQQEVKRKRFANESLERRLLVAQQHKLQCQEDLRLCKKMAEKHKMRAQEKQVEVEILGKSVEELENTVFALESQVGLLKREGDRQCLVREEMESELRVLQLQNTVIHATLTEASGTSGTNRGGVKRESNAERRKLKEREVKKLEHYQMGSDENDSFSQTKNIQKEKENAKRLSVGSAFRCFNMNHQVHSELDEERKSYERRILELEGVLEKHQYEVTVRNERLEDAERIARDALR